MTFTPTTQLLAGLIAVSLLMVILWLIQRWTNDAGIVDVGWSGSLGVLALFYGCTLTETSVRSWLVVTLATLWSVRLAVYLLFNRIIGKHEDGRYQALRQKYGSRVQTFFFGFYQLQALVAWLFSLPFWWAMQRSGPAPDLFDVIAVLIWLLAFVGELVADWQLARFRGAPANKGKTCRRGLWSVSRHPNYFCEWLHWWVYVLIAWQAPFGWITLFAPALMLFFLFKVTGLPATEAQAVASRGDDYRDYQRTVSPFIPWFPKRSL
jgi:steroid 5-alpha reductase family enzyme